MAERAEGNGGAQGEQPPKQGERTWTEHIEVAGSQLIGRVRGLIAEGNVRRLIIRSPEDNVLIEIPLTAGVVAGGALALFAPVLAAIGAIAGLLVKVKVEVVRTEGDSQGDSQDDPKGEA
jgi:hypothetical protein